MHRMRIGRLQELMQEREAEALWVESSVNFRYLTGHLPVSIERLMGLVVPAQGNLRLVVPRLLHEEVKDLELDDVHVWDDGDNPADAAGRALVGISKLHVHGDLPMWAAETLRSSRAGLELEIDDGLLGTLREKKDDEEIELLAESGSITDDVVEWVGTLDLDGVTERELAGRIRAHYLELGKEPADWALVASGANAAMPHFGGGEEPISTTDPLLLDFGGAVDGYWSDITRVYFPRDLDPKIKEAYDAVCAAAEAAFSTVATGVACKDVDRAARSVLEGAGLGEYFVHRTGHGLGLSVHEPPYITSANEQALEVGHVFSIEPGVYVPGEFGLRYENIVCLTADGPRSLNNSPREHFFSA